MADSEVRNKMKHYWEEHSQNCSNIDMMLDENANEMSQRDIEDVQSMLPEMKGKRILELGAGIGRYTGWLVGQAEHIVAVDFIEKFLNVNRESNESKGNIEFQCADATKLNFAPGSFDVVFSNWLLMYLSDSETLALFRNILGWLKPGGSLFFRESCNRPSGNKRRSENPTIYRKLSDYDCLLKAATVFDRPGEYQGFELLLVRSNQAYVDLKKNPFQLCFLAQKRAIAEDSLNGYRSFHDLLDQQHYTKEDLEKFQLLFGENDPRKTEPLLASTVQRLNLHADGDLLEVGCGLGSDAFYFAEKFGARVYAMDLSANMIEQALEAFDNSYKQHHILFEIADATQRTFHNNKFDAIYCCDTIPHIRDKKALFERFHRWLKPDGRLCIAALCKGIKETELELTDHLIERDFFLTSGSETQKMLSEVGFSDVEMFNESSRLIESEKGDLVKAGQTRDKFVSLFGEEDYLAAVKAISTKLRWLASNQLQWIVIYANKLGSAYCLTPPKTPCKVTSV